MAALILPSRRIVQPQGPVEVDWGNPLARGLVIAWTPSSDRDAVAGASANASISLRVAGRHGFAQSGNASELNFRFDDNARQRTSHITTLSLLRRVGTVPPFTGSVSKVWDSNQDPTYVSDELTYNRAGSGQNNIAATFGRSGGNTSTDSYSHPDTTQWHTSGLTGDGATGRLYVDGRMRASIAISPIAYAPFGDNSITTRLGAYFEHAFVYRWNRALSDAEIAEVTANPWQIFRPIQRRILISVDAGAGAPPAGTVTITSVTPAETTASVVYSYNDTDEDSFEYRLDGGTPAAIGASPATITGLTASTLYDSPGIEVRAINADGEGAWSTPESFTTTTPDTTAPTLTSGVGTVKSNALIIVGATTDEANGTLYTVVTTSATPPSAAQVMAGQNNAGTAAVFAANQSISSTGAKTFNATGFTQLTGYYPYLMHRDAAGNNSSVLSVGLRTTFRDGATGQAVVDDTAAADGNPAGIMFNDVVLPGDADKWFAYRVVTPVVDTASLTLFPNGSFIWEGTSADSFTYQLEVDGVDTGSPALVSLDPAGGDVTAPTLSAATGTKTGATTATGSVSTNEGNGTLYYLTNTSASALSAAVLAGSTQAVSGTGVQNISRTGLTASTTYYHHFLHKDAAGNDSAVLSSAGFTTDPPPDVTAPTLTSPTATATGSTTATGTVTTNESGGTLYHLVSTSPTATGAEVKAGSSQAVSASGLQNVSRTGLTASTAYYLHYLHRDAAGNDSAVSTSAQFTTSAPADVTPPTLSLPTATTTGATTASGTVTTNEANGTLYWVATTNASESAATVKAGFSQAVSATGVQNVGVTGLNPSTAYRIHYVHRDAAGNDSTVSSSAEFTTNAFGGGGGDARGTKGLRLSIGLSL